MDVILAIDDMKSDMATGLDALLVIILKTYKTTLEKIYYIYLLQLPYMG